MKVFDATSRRTPHSVRELHGLTGRFASINHLRQLLRTELGDDLPSSYNVGYFEGRNHAKRWLTTDRDVVAVNEKFASGDVCLWCDARQVESVAPSRDRSPPRK